MIRRSQKYFAAHPSRRSRRDFLAKLSSAAATISLGPGFRSLASTNLFLLDQVDAATLAADPLRPQFHLLPARNWMNDPNGPIYWQGQYHMFFQYNPNAAVWGDIHWAHAVSPDMMHWKHLPIALAPTPGGPDQEGCFTGSAVDDRGTATFIYTGVANATPEQATLRDGTHNFRETQCLATAIDSGLRSWKKLAQPIVNPPSDPLLTGFRDPFLWQEGATWYLGVGSGKRKAGGCVLVYRSANLRVWESVGTLASGEWNGQDTPDVVDSGEMWECPDFFALGEKHVLIYSTGRQVYWESGELDHQEMKFHSQKQGLLDSGAYYAPKTQTAANGERILWGWITEKRSDDELRRAGWAGCMSLPRVLSLDADGFLLMRPAPEATKLRGKQFTLPATTTPVAARLRALREFRLANLAAEISLRIRNAPFSMSFTDRQQTFLTISFDPARTGGELVVNGSASALRAGTEQEIAITVFIDGSVIEVFANERACCTARLYQTSAKSLSLDITEDALRNVASLHGWQMTPISPDRLTT
jgi:beta-fructofuranosidase